MDKNVVPKTSNVNQPYDESFYSFITKSSLESAKKIVLLVMEFIRPSSVVDVGCGISTWLSVFQEQGIDGDYVFCGNSISGRRKSCQRAMAGLLANLI